MSRPLHVALIHGWYPPIESFGGIVRYLVDLASGLTEAGHRVTVISRDDVHPRVDAYEGVPVVRVRVRQGSRGLPERFDPLLASRAYARALGDLHARDPVDIAEFSNYTGEGGWHAVRKRVPHVCRVVTTAWQSRANALREPSLGDRWKDVLESVSIRRSDLVIVPAAAHAAEIQSHYRLPTAPAVVTLAVADVPGSPEAPRDDSRPVRFLMVGKLDRRKGLDVLLDAIVLLDGETTDFEVVVAGGDAYLPDGSTYAAAAMANAASAALARVRFAGWVSDEELLRLYGSSDVLVAPSRYESFGLMVPEAMRVGLPIVATTAGGMAELVENGLTGLTVPVEDAHALASAMRSLLRDASLRRAMGQRAREAYESRFTVRAMTDATIEAYERLLESRRAAG